MREEIKREVSVGRKGKEDEERLMEGEDGDKGKRRKKLKVGCYRCQTDICRLQYNQGWTHSREVSLGQSTTSW